MAPSGLQAHNQNHAGLPPGINPQVRPQCSPRWGRFLRGDYFAVTEGIFQEPRAPQGRAARTEAAGGSHRRHSGSERVIAKVQKKRPQLGGEPGPQDSVGVGAEKKSGTSTLLARGQVPGDSLIRVTPFWGVAPACAPP